jgi:hypothetical protein
MTQWRIVVLAIPVLIVVGVYATAPDSSSRPNQDTPRTPVLVELFTSEGCSSCPAADSVLARLVEEQPVPGVELIALGFHVDYWDRLGWRDPFSSPHYSARQSAYARAWRTSSIYTPQAVVDGTRELIGSDWNAALRFVHEAKSSSKVSVTVDVQQSPIDRRQVSLRLEVGRSDGQVAKGDVLLAVAEDGVTTNVRRGENANRALSHAAVVRSLERVGTMDLRTGFAAMRNVTLDPLWNRDALKVVVFVQAPTSLRVFGAAARQL